MILIGNSGSGKSVLPVLFANYLSNYENVEDIVLNSVNSLGKSYSNKEWHLKRDVVQEILPILPFEGKDCSFTVNDSFTSVGYFKIDPRFKFRDKRLINHLLQLQEEDPDQDLNLKIKVGEKRSEAKYLKINDLRYDIDFFKEEYSASENNSKIFKFLKRSINHPTEKYFLIVENLDKETEKDFLNLLTYIDGEYINKSENNNLFVIGNVNISEFNNISDLLIDRVSFIELPDTDINTYFSDSFNKFPELNDINYLEFVNDNVLNLSVVEFKDIFQGIWCNGSDLWSLISNEITLFHNIFSNEGISINFRLINDILRFMVVSWKYEGNKHNWDNWEKYFDIQLCQKLLSKISKIPSSPNFFNELLELCIKSNNEDFNEDNIKYRNTYLKIRNMQQSLELDDFSYFKCFKFVKSFADAPKTSSINKKISKKSSDNGGSKYGSNIYKNGDYFTINKQINGKHINFGKFNTLDEAKFVKNILVENEWKLYKIRNNDCIYENNNLFWVIKVLNNKLNVLGKFYSYKDAEEHIDWLISEFKNNENFEVYVPSDGEILNSDRREEVISNLTGWEKLVFNAINEIKGMVFSLNDLKRLDLFMMYQFEDESLETTIKENLDNLANLKLIKVMGNDYYKKVF